MVIVLYVVGVLFACEGAVLSCVVHGTAAVMCCQGVLSGNEPLTLVLRSSRVRNVKVLLGDGSPTACLYTPIHAQPFRIPPFLLDGPQRRRYLQQLSRPAQAPTRMSPRKGWLPLWMAAFGSSILHPHSPPPRAPASPLPSCRRAGRPCVLPLQGHGGWRQDRPAAAVGRWAVDSHALRTMVEGGELFFVFVVPPALQWEPLFHTRSFPSNETG